MGGREEGSFQKEENFVLNINLFHKETHKIPTLPRDYHAFRQSLASAGEAAGLSACTPHGVKSEATLGLV